MALHTEFPGKLYLLLWETIISNRSTRLLGAAVITQDSLTRLEDWHMRLSLTLFRALKPVSCVTFTNPRRSLMVSHS